MTIKPGIWLDMKTNATPPDDIFVATASISTHGELFNSPSSQKDLTAFVAAVEPRQQPSMFISALQFSSCRAYEFSVIYLGAQGSNPFLLAQTTLFMCSYAQISSSSLLPGQRLPIGRVCWLRRRRNSRDPPVV